MFIVLMVNHLSQNNFFFPRPPDYHVVVNIENRLEDFPIFFFIIPFIFGEVGDDPK